MFDRIAPRYDLTNSVLSFGTHHGWRKKLVKYSGARQGEHVLDVATGTGDLAFAFSRVVGEGGSVTGVDFVPKMIELAQEKLSKRYRNSLSFQVADAMNLPFEDESFNIVSISFGIRNVENPVKALEEFQRVLKPGGRVVVLEFGQPTLPIFSTGYRLYSKYLMPAIGSTLTGDRAAYEYLPETAGEFPCRAEFTSLMEKAGFVDNRWKAFTGGIAFAYRGRKA